ncbi:NAD-dependent succinate-semialdehyde dehydrogenase [Auritidibacter ignavus]|uniref:NAD-dependent succinate-semialdehyde dehydrogenase n=1 Tax=Auritidibacter ignavus TaxID=678932 RepID=UPI00109D2353|nr:NAD-dependent succinate-semialdehyde dehydrogenase [Auritidibacter ignavus]
MTTYAVTNPATGAVEKTYPTATDEQITEAVNLAAETFTSYGNTSFEQRAQWMHRVADLYEERLDQLCSIITREMGKPVRQAEFEVKISISIYRYYADHAAEFLADEELPVARGGQAKVQYDPVGVLLGIMPWNFPYYQVARFAGPNLMAGNTIVLKHAPQCPESAEVMEQIFHEAGFPAGAYVNIYASNEQIADRVIPDPRVQGVSLTGSDRAGAAVAETAGKHLKKVVLELGGNDPFIVLDREIVPQAVELAATSRFGNAGQACNAAKRLIVLEEFYDDFVEQLKTAVEQVQLGDPTQPETAMGPMSSQQALENLDAQVRDAIDHGATAHVGGAPEDREGAWYPATLLTGLTPEMRAYSEELFGPVAMVYSVASEEEAIKLANDTPYGLTATVHSSDPARAAEVGNQIHTGQVFINETSTTAAELPFGGVKRSGFGRELGPYGIKEFVNVRLVKYSKN